MYDNLYESLSYNIPNRELSQEEKNFIVKHSVNLNEEQKEIVYLLILYHHIKENPNSKVILPYKMKQKDTYLEIKLEALDKNMKQILFKFISQIYPDKEIEMIETNDASKPEKRNEDGNQNIQVI